MPFWIASIVLAAGGGWLASAAFTSGAAGRGPRFPQLTMDHLTDAQRPLAEQIMKISSTGIGGPYNALLRSPVMGQRMYDLLDYLRWRTSMPTRLNEFAILIQGRLWRSQVEWYAHFPLAVKAGLSEQVALDLKANKRPEGMQPDEAAVYDFCMEISTKHAVSDETFNRLRQFLSEQQVVDLTVLSGTYVTVAMILSVSEANVPAGKDLPFKPGEP
jgi:4-carboxymuconolactone decarboxylase